MIDWIVCPHCAGAGTYRVKNNPGWICAFSPRTCGRCNGRQVVPVNIKSPGSHVSVVIRATFQSQEIPLDGTSKWQPWSRDDGVSQEFAVDVQSVEEV